MNRTFLILTCLILAVLIESVYSRRERVNFRADGHKHTSASESASAEGSNSWEDEYNRERERHYYYYYFYTYYFTELII